MVPAAAPPRDDALRKDRPMYWWIHRGCWILRIGATKLACSQRGAGGWET